MRLLRDLSLSAVIAGFVAVLVGFTSSAAIVFSAAQASGASDAEIASWMWALGLGMGATCIGLSLRYRVPVVTAWSTPGAAMLITGAAGLPLAEIVGAFVVSAVLTTALGFSGWLERALSRLPTSLASGMLAGVLLRFGLNVFTSMQAQFALVFAMFLGWLLARRWSPRYAVVITLAIGVAIAAVQGQLHLGDVRVTLAQPIWITPKFSLAAVIGVAIPLFVVTMASQNIPGIAILRAHGYQETPVSPLIGWTGLVTLVLAPFGAFALNLAAITAAICAGPDAHPDPQRRYIAAVTSGLAYVAMGILAPFAAGFITASPPILIEAVAGLALFGAFGSSSLAFLSAPKERDAALVTFVTTASGFSVFGIGAAFWGLVAGGAVLLLHRVGRQA